MPSYVFSSVDFESVGGKQLVRDIRRLLDLPESDLAVCLDLARNLLGEKGFLDSQKESVALQEAGATSTPAVKLQSALACLEFLVKRYAEGENVGDDSVEATNELRSQSVLTTDEDAGRWQRVLSTVREKIAPRYRIANLERIFSTGVFPVLRGFGATVEMRAVQAQFFSESTDEESFDPKIQSLVAIASVSLTTNLGQDAAFRFQMDRRVLTWLIRSLRAVEKQLAALEQHVEGRYLLQTDQEDSLKIKGEDSR